jgi:type VI secretion system protein
MVAAATRQGRRRTLRAALGLGALLWLGGWLGGCALNPWYEPPTVFTKLLQFKVAEGANHNQSIAFDLVIVMDEKLLEKLLALGAEEWFTQREQWKRDHPAGLRTWEWELVPGQPVEPFRLSGAAEAAAVLVFARYSTEGPHRARLDPYEVVTIELGEKGFELRPVFKQ